MYDPYLSWVQSTWLSAFEAPSGRAERFAAWAVEYRQLYIELPETPFQGELHDLEACLEARVWVDSNDEEDCRTLLSEFHEWVEWLADNRYIRDNQEDPEVCGEASDE